MTTIDITTLFGQDLKSRSSVGDLLMYVKSTHDETVCIDFSKVQFATRSFIDEYYNTFIDDHGKLDGIKVQTTNLPDDITHMINVVSQTQSGKRIYEEPANISVKSFTNIKDLTTYLRSLCL